MVTVPQSRKKAILFDFDGVVVNSEQLYENYYRMRFEEYGIQLPQSEWSLFKGISSKVIFNLIRKRYMPHADIQSLIHEWQFGLRDYMKKNLAYTEYFRPFFRMISGSFQTALVTSSTREMVEWIFTNTVIDNHFPHIVTSDDVIRTKPDPEPYLKAAEFLRVDISDCIVIEDSLRGITSGKKAGAFVVAITTSMCRRDLRDADYIIDSWAELPIEKLWSF